MSQKNSDSAKHSAIEGFLKRYADGKYATAGIEFDYFTGEFLVLINALKISVTERSLAMLQRRISKDVNVSVQVRSMHGESDEMLISTVFKALAKKLGETLADVILAVNVSREVDIVLVITHADESPTKLEKSKIKKRLANMLETLDLSLGDLCYSTLHDNTPSSFQLIRQLYSLAPCKPESLFHQLLEKGHEIPSIQWLKRRLDDLARQGHIQWDAKCGYALTEKGVSTLPRLEHRNSRAHLVV